MPLQLCRQLGTRGAPDQPAWDRQDAVPYALTTLVRGSGVVLEHTLSKESFILGSSRRRHHHRHRHRQWLHRRRGQQQHHHRRTPTDICISGPTLSGGRPGVPPAHRRRPRPRHARSIRPTGSRPRRPVTTTTTTEGQERLTLANTYSGSQSLTAHHQAWPGRAGVNLQQPVQQLPGGRT